MDKEKSQRPSKWRWPFLFFVKIDHWSLMEHGIWGLGGFIVCYLWWGKKNSFQNRLWHSPAWGQADL